MHIYIGFLFGTFLTCRDGSVLLSTVCEDRSCKRYILKKSLCYMENLLKCLSYIYVKSL